MVIHKFNLVGAIFVPFETDPPLPVDSNAVLPVAVSAQGFKSITRQSGQIFETGGTIKGLKAALGLGDESLKSANPTPKVKCLSVFVSKASNHT